MLTLGRFVLERPRSRRSGARRMVFLAGMALGLRQRPRPVEVGERGA